MLGERFTSDALDVDSYAESMLNELGVTERGRIDPMEKLGRQLAAATTPRRGVALSMLSSWPRIGALERKWLREPSRLQLSWQCETSVTMKEAE